MKRDVTARLSLRTFCEGSQGTPGFAEPLQGPAQTKHRAREKVKVTENAELGGALEFSPCREPSGIFLWLSVSHILCF